MPWNIQDQLIDLERRHLRRTLREVAAPQGVRVNVAGQDVVNFSSNDYLGLANHEQIREAFVEGVRRHGAGSGASRLVCGTLTPHVELEDRLAEFKTAEAALTFSSGFAAALGTIPALVGSDDVIILDKLSHASLVDAARLSGATIRVFPHNHVGKLEKLLQGAAGKRALVVTESIFSMDGDAAVLREIVELKDRHGAMLMLDEAHAVGVLGPQGRGLAAAFGLESRIDIQMGTLSKAFGLSGGYIAARREVIDLLINKARSFVYSTAPPPAIAHAAVKALQIIQSEEGDALRARLHGWTTMVRTMNPQETAEHDSQDMHSAIVPVIVGDEQAALDVSQALLGEGLLIPAIRYPTVAKGSARLRVTLSAAHSSDQVAQLVTHLKQVVLPRPPGA